MVWQLVKIFIASGSQINKFGSMLTEIIIMSRKSTHLQQYQMTVISDYR